MSRREGEYPYTPREWQRLNAIDRQEKFKTIRLALIMLLLLVVMSLMGFLVYFLVFRSHDYQLPLSYDREDSSRGIYHTLNLNNTAVSYAQNLCVTDRDINTDQLFLQAYSAGLFNLDEKEVCYAKDIFTTRDPASIS